MNIHEKYESSAIKDVEKYINDFIGSDAGHQRQVQKGDAKEYALWMAANVPAKRQLLELALVEMNEWYTLHGLKDLLISALK